MSQALVKRWTLVWRMLKISSSQSGLILEDGRISNLRRGCMRWWRKRTSAKRQMVLEGALRTALGWSSAIAMRQVISDFLWPGFNSRMISMNQLVHEEWLLLGLHSRWSWSVWDFSFISRDSISKSRLLRNMGVPWHAIGNERWIARDIVISSRQLLER